MSNDPERCRARCVAGRMRARGAALIETAILLLVLIPLMFAIPMIGKLIDVRQTSVQAGRYATWQATVARGDEQRASQVAARFFGTEGAPLSTEPVESGVNRLWGDTGAARATGPGAARPEAFVDNWPGYGDVRIDAATVTWDPWSTGHGDTGVAGAVGDAIGLAGKALGGDRWDLAETSLTRAEVGVDIRSNRWLDAQGVDCGAGYSGCVREAGVILVDGWSAADDERAQRRVEALVPATHLESVGNLLSGLGNVPLLRELRDMEGMFGHVDMQPLPEHADRRLPTYQEPDE